MQLNHKGLTLMISFDTIATMSNQIAREFDPEKIVLFGSYASGTARTDSDVDLLVILPFSGTGFRKSLEILNRINPPFDVDLIARRPDEADKGYREGDPMLRNALDHGKVLYERHR
jgi:uncharacterized protein